MEFTTLVPGNNLRDYLRRQTAAVHERLDKTVGEMDSAAAYRAFVARSFAFRSAVEPTIPGVVDWAPLSIVDALRNDLDDLGYGPVQVPALEPASGLSGGIGRLYVLEGSSVGARILYQRARKLGYSEGFGATHLAQQTGEQTRWKQFTSFLGSVQGIDHAEALAAAKHLFEFAIDVYSRPHGGPGEFDNPEWT